MSNPLRISHESLDLEDMTDLISDLNPCSQGGKSLQEVHPKPQLSTGLKQRPAAAPKVVQSRVGMTTPSGLQRPGSAVKSRGYGQPNKGMTDTSNMSQQSS